MVEAISPDPTTGQRQRPPPMLSPTSIFFLRSNDDQLERAQSRAARAAAVRRKSLAAASLHPQRLDADSDHCLSKQQILDLFQNCIKLASENKINQRNTWELNLIDHLTDIIRVEEDDDVETNFQMASCTLEAGVKIYSLRVDYVHATAYKVLGGMNRAGQEAGQDTMLDGVNAESGQEERRKVTDKKLSPLSTLESSFDILNVKKFDAGFTVDPLYRQTSALFDEGGAKDCIEQMVLSMHMKDEISPTLRVIVNQIDEQNRRPSDFQFCGQKPGEEFEAAIDCEIEPERGEYENCLHWSNNHDDDRRFVADHGSNDADANFPSYPQENYPFPSEDSDDISQNVDGYLLSSLGFLLKKNSWAGPDHWKYRKAKDGLTLNSQQPRTKRQVQVELDFTNFLEKQVVADVFSPPKNPKSLLLPESRPPCNTKYPEDCHYEPEDLVKLFLLPNVKCLGRSGRKSSGVSDGSREQHNEYESFHSWDDGGVCDDEYDGDVHSDVDDSSILVSQPRQINKIEVQYDKTSKQVDVQALKITLWDHIQESVQFPLQGQQPTVSFRHILANLPSECNAAATVSDISPHLCFICLLHLANEKGLSIQSCPNLDDLSIYLSDVCATTSGID